MITLDEIINDSKAVIHTPKEWQAEKLCAELDKRGKTWCDGLPYSETLWHSWGSSTCYRPSDCMYADVDFYKEKGYTIHEFSDIADFKEKSDLNPRQWATYRFIKAKSEKGLSCSQWEICGNYPASEHKDGYSYVENPSHGDHCRQILSDVYAINESYEIEKIVVVRDMAYKLGTYEECADYYWRLVIPAGKKEHRAKLIKDKMAQDGQGQLLSRSLREIYRNADKKTRAYIETYIDGSVKGGGLKTPKE